MKESRCRIVWGEKKVLCQQIRRNLLAAKSIVTGVGFNKIKKGQVPTAKLKDQVMSSPPLFFSLSLSLSCKLEGPQLFQADNLNHNMWPTLTKPSAFYELWRYSNPDIISPDPAVSCGSPHYPRSCRILLMSYHQGAALASTVSGEAILFPGTGNQSTLVECNTSLVDSSLDPLCPSWGTHSFHHFWSEPRKRSCSNSGLCVLTWWSWFHIGEVGFSLVHPCRNCRVAVSFS